jgi:hypothetical protein
MPEAGQLAADLELLVQALLDRFHPPVPCPVHLAAGSAAQEALAEAREAAEPMVEPVERPNPDRY